MIILLSVDSHLASRIRQYPDANKFTKQKKNNPGSEK